MSTIDTSTWNPDPALNESIGDIPLNESASIAQTWQAIQMLMAAGGLHGLQLVTFDGATASADGKQGLVPAPEAGDQDKVLKGDGTWGTASVSSIDASKITSGTIDLARLPAGALERLVTVADQTARFALTAADVQLGDTVKQLDTGVMYIVVDTSKLNQAAGYVEYTAGSAASVPWSGVTGKPSTFPPSSHAHGSITNDGKLGTASRVIVTDGSKVIGVSSITTTKLGYLTDVTANIQGQINGKADDSAVVHKTGDEGISGTKTFNSRIAGTIGMSVGDGGYADMIQTYQSDNGANRSCTIRCTNGDGYNSVLIGAHDESNGVPSGLTIQNTNGVVTGGFAGSLRLTKVTDASGTADNSPALSIGSTSGTHLELDGNEIMAKASGTTTGPFYINAQGGDVYIGGNTDNYKSVTGRGKGSTTVPVYTDANGIVTACGSSLDVDVSGNASTASKLATSVTINDVSFDGSASITVADSTKVSKSGDTMTGNLTVKKSAPQIILRDPSFVRGTAPEANYYGLEILGKDYNNRSTWCLYHTYETNKTNRIRLLCYNGLTTDNQYAEIGVGYDSDGNPYTNAPTPATGDNSTKIATTAFVKTKCDGYLPLSGGVLTGALFEKPSNVNLAVEPESSKEDYRFCITRSDADTVHNGSLMRLGVSQPTGTKDYRIMLAVANPRAGNLPTQESIAGGVDDPDARTSNCWGGIGVYYDYSKNRAYPYCYDLNTCELTDDSTQRLATNYWVRHATGDFACNAASASTVPWSGVTGKPSELDALSGVESNIQAQLNGKIEESDLCNWQKTNKAGAVAFKPVPESGLEPVVDFMFMETPPAEGEKVPENPSTITGVTQAKVTRCGKNLLAFPYPDATKTEAGITWTVNEDGSVTANGTAESTVFFYFSFSNNTYTIPGTKYTLSGCPSGGSSSTYALRYGSFGYETGSGFTFTASDSLGVVARINSGATVSNLVFRPQLELGSTATAFEPYEGHDYTISLGDTYYGGSIDFANGVMTVTWDAIVLDGTENWTLDSTSTSTLSIFRCSPSLSHTMSDSPSSTTRSCSHFAFANSGYPAENRFSTWGGVTRIYIMLPAASYPNKASLTSWLASENSAGHPVVISYKVNEPYAVQLSPVQIPALAQTDKYTPRINTIYTDAQAVQVGYQRFFDEKRLAALEARIEALENADA